jgi:hypothetical protein
MSVYGGFTTRHQESVYNDLTLKLLDLMQQRLLEHPALKEDLVWSHQLSKVVKSMRQLEQHKYLDPKLSQGVDLLFSQVDRQSHREQLSSSSSLRSDNSAKPTSKSSELHMTAGKLLKTLQPLSIFSSPLNLLPSFFTHPTTSYQTPTHLLCSLFA